jgi:hypothetical protein
VTRVLTAVHDGDESTVTVDGVPSRWRVTSAAGELGLALLADRPTEERARTSWSVRWAVPVAGDAAGCDVPVGRLSEGVAAVVHAPTPTDEPLGLPALLLASFPLSPDRRHVAPGPLTDFLIDRAADAYAELLPRLPATAELLDLVPGPVGTGELDARLAQAIVARLPQVPFLRAAAAEHGRADDDEADDAGAGLAGAGLAGAELPGGEQPAAGRVAPRDAVLLAADHLSAGLAGRLAPVLTGLVDGPVRHPAWAVLGVRKVSLAELADLLAVLDREPEWWAGLYAELAGLAPPELAELGALPVPLADGRLVRGPRGLLLPGPGLADMNWADLNGADRDQADRDQADRDQAGHNRAGLSRLSVLGLRVVHPGAAHPLLTRLGAVEGTPRSVLADPATRAAVAASYDKATEAYYDDEEPGLTADAVLSLLAAVDAAPGEYPWAADLALPAADGDWYPAGELLLPGAPLAQVLATDSPFGTVSREMAERHGTAALRAAGVLSSFGLLLADDVELDEAAIDLDVDGAADWAAQCRESVPRAAGGLPLPPVAVTVAAVRDLDLVAEDRWPQALELLLAPPLRAAVIEPVLMRLPDGRAAAVPSYTAWWLRRHVRLDWRRPGELRTADADPLLAGLYEDADDLALPAVLNAMLSDPAVARAIGIRSSLAGLLAEPGGADELLGRLADPRRTVTRSQLHALWSALAGDALAAEGGTASGGPGEPAPPERVRAVLGDKVIVADAADVLVLDAPDLWPLVAGQPLILAPHPRAARLADLLDLPLASEEVPGIVESAGELGRTPAVVRDVLPAAPATYWEHDGLMVDDTDVPWRYVDGELHAATVEGLAHGLAWAAGRWSARHLLTSLLTSPEDTAQLLAEADLERY